MTKEEIISQLKLVSEKFISDCAAIPSELFFFQPGDKWSIAQNVTHLATSAKMTKLAYALPKFMIRLYAGRPNRPSKNFEELVSKYKMKLEQGGKASGRFIPKMISQENGKDNILQQFENGMKDLSSSIQKKWTDPQLDQYIAPHPLLGKITLRELGYFTIYHTKHHNDIILERLKS